MKLTTQNIAQMLTQSPVPTNNIGGLILTYFHLKQKLEHKELQTFYFKKGLESNVRRLQRLRKSYASVRNFYNSHSLDDLIQLKNERQEQLDRIKSGSRINMITGIWVNSLRSNLAQLDAILPLKRDFEILATIDEYETDTPLLIQLIEAPTS